MPETLTCKQEVEITVPLDEIQRETDHVVSHIRQRAQLPGFRPGKAPATLIRTKFKNEIRQDVLEAVIPKAFRARAEQEHWKVVGSPNVVDFDFKEGEPLRFKAEFEVAPEFELGEYRGVEAPYAEPSATPEAVAERLEQIRNQKAQLVNEDPRPLADGDYAVVAMRSVAGVDQPIQTDETQLHLGDADTLEDFTTNLRGASPGDEREFDVTYPAEYGREDLSGKTIRFHVQVKGLRRREIPELNDEFARDLGDYQNLDELRETIRKSLLAEREHAEQSESKGKIIDKLVDAHAFPVPDSYVDRQLQNIMETRVRRLVASGIDPRALDVDWNKIRENQRGQAERDVRASLILERIADAESIHVTNDEVDREVQRIARQEREPAAAVRMRLEKDGTLGRIANHIRTEKVLTFLFENARKVAKPDEPPPGEPASDQG